MADQTIFTPMVDANRDGEGDQFLQPWLDSLAQSLARFDLTTSVRENATDNRFGDAKDASPTAAFDKDERVKFPAPSPAAAGYVGRFAPSPSGHLHVGHAQTFWLAQERARQWHIQACRAAVAACRPAPGPPRLLLRLEDIDTSRCRPEFARQVYEDMKWMGLHWDVGPVLWSEVQLPSSSSEAQQESKRDAFNTDSNSGAVAGADSGSDQLLRHRSSSLGSISSTGSRRALIDPAERRRLEGDNDLYIQSRRRAVYLGALQRLRQLGWVYPCRQSRRDVKASLSAPHDDVLPGTPTLSAPHYDDEIQHPRPAGSMTRALGAEMVGEDVVFPPRLRPIYMQYQVGDEFHYSRSSSSSSSSSSSGYDVSRAYRLRARAHFASVVTATNTSAQSIEPTLESTSPIYKSSPLSPTPLAGPETAGVAQSSASFTSKRTKRRAASTATPARCVVAAGAVATGLADLGDTVNWRFRVPDGQQVCFRDGCFLLPGDKAAINEAQGSVRPERGTDSVCFTAGQDFGDFLVWRSADGGSPSYELAATVDDLLHGVTEVVRAQDLLVSTARQLLLARALLEAEDAEATMAATSSMGGDAPAVARSAMAAATIAATDVHRSRALSNFKNREIRYFHVPLLCDENGKRLAKRTDAKSLRQLRSEGYSAEQIREQFFRVPPTVIAALARGEE